jgi:hypothetical protein
MMRLFNESECGFPWRRAGLSTCVEIKICMQDEEVHFVNFQRINFDIDDAIGIQKI